MGPGGQRISLGDGLHFVHSDHDTMSCEVGGAIKGRRHPSLELQKCFLGDRLM